MTDDSANTTGESTGNSGDGSAPGDTPRYDDVRAEGDGADRESDTVAGTAMELAQTVRDAVGSGDDMDARDAGGAGSDDDSGGVAGRVRRGVRSAADWSAENGPQVGLDHAATSFANHTLLWTAVLMMSGGAVAQSDPCATALGEFTAAIQALVASNVVTLMVALILVAGVAYMVPSNWMDKVGNAIGGGVFKGMAYLAGAFTLVGVLFTVTPMSASATCGSMLGGDGGGGTTESIRMVGTLAVAGAAQTQLVAGVSEWLSSDDSAAEQESESDE